MCVCVCVCVCVRQRAWFAQLSTWCGVLLPHSLSCVLVGYAHLSKWCPGPNKLWGAVEGPKGLVEEEAVLYRLKDWGKVSGGSRSPFFTTQIHTSSH